MKIIYFSWVKKDLGVSEEKISPPKNIKNIQLLIEWLSSKNYKYEKVFLKKKLIKVAVNHQVVNLNKKIKKSDEIAFFPPFTGG